MKQGWEIKKLGEVCSLIADGDWIESRHQSDDGIRLIQTGNIGNGVFKAKDNKPHYISESTFVELGCTEIFAGDCLVSRLPDPVGRACIIPETNCRMITAVDCSIIRFNSDIVSKFFIYYTQCEKYKRDINNNTTGTTRKRISRKNLETITTPIPPREEQERIVEELDCLSGVIEKKREQLRELDALAQSIFYQMFGDPITNEKGFPVYKIDDIITFQGGSQPDKSHFEYEPTDDNIRLIQIRDYKSDKNITYIPKSLARRLCNAEDIMIGRYGPPIFQILKGIEGAYNVALMKAIPKQGNREFIRAFLKQKCLLEYLESMSKRTAGQDGIQMDKLKAYPFPLPPIELQDEFADKIEAIEKQKELIKKSISETETLFNARMDYYFN